MATSPNNNDWMEQLAKRLFTITLVALILVMILITCSCGSKKKLIQKTQFTTEIATVERVNEEEKTESKTAISVSETIKERNVSQEKNFQGEIADPTKPATITEEEHGGKKTITYTNFKNVSSGSNLSESETNKEKGQDLTKNVKTETSRQKEKEATAKATGSERNVDVEIEKGFPWWWIIIALLIYGAVSYFRGMNPLKWFK